MTIESTVLICIAIAIVAFLYSSVGHAGASGYIAVMTLFGLSSAIIKPSALTLNIVVACLASWQFWRAGHFSWRLFWPFAVFSIPFAFSGGSFQLPTRIFNVLIGSVLLYSAARFLITSSTSGNDQSETATPPAKPVAFAAGAGIGLLSGLTGTGGGIFLTPLMIFRQWADTKTASAVSALFILVNSIAGLLGYYRTTRQLPGVALYLVAAALAGGALGSYLGSRRFSSTFIKKLLAVVLIIAGTKLIFA
ncbi:MAG: sulfite exporter TauE/SafE family protein [Blastocatellia bacterium]